MGIVIKIVLIPSLGRSATDFDDLVSVLESNGFECLAIEPPSHWDGEPTLHDLAQYVVDTAAAEGFDSFHLVGHAFGNRLSRTVAADYPEKVQSLVLLACGGHVRMEPSIQDSLFQCFNYELTETERHHHVARGFFADGNMVPQNWLGGWLPEVAKYQSGAVARTPLEDWWDAVAPRVLVVQALQDAIAVPENSAIYVSDHSNIAQLVEIDGAGHAMLPEQPEAIAVALLAFWQNKS